MALGTADKGGKGVAVGRKDAAADAVGELLTCDVNGNGGLYTVNETAALGIEADLDRRGEKWVFRSIAVVGKAPYAALLVDDLAGVVALLLWTAENGEHPGEAGLASPVNHPSGVCSDFIKTASKDIVQLYIAGTEAVLQTDLACFKHITSRTYKLNVEDTAQTTETVERTVDHIGLEAHGLAYEVASVVEMKICLLLRIGTVEGVYHRRIAQKRKAVVLAERQ